MHQHTSAHFKTANHFQPFKPNLSPATKHNHEDDVKVPVTFVTNFSFSSNCLLFYLIKANFFVWFQPAFCLPLHKFTKLFLNGLKNVFKKNCSWNMLFSDCFFSIIFLPSNWLLRLIFVLIIILILILN